MKPFSKYEALQGKPVVTRGGKKVLYITEIPLDISYPIVAVIEGEFISYAFTSDGKFLKSPESYHNYDLFMVSTVKEGWIAFGTTEIKTIVGFATHVFSDKTRAEEIYSAVNYGRKPAGTVKVTWEE